MSRDLLLLVDVLAREKNVDEEVVFRCVWNMLWDRRQKNASRVKWISA